MSTQNLASVVFWPKADNLNIYFAKSEDNLISFETNLWQELSPEEITRLAVFLKNKKITNASVLIDDSVVFTRSFVYDEKVTTVSLDDVVTLAKGTAPFEIIPSQVTYEVIPQGEKTLIQARIFDQAKLSPLLKNLSALNLKLAYFSLSEGLIKLFDHFCDKPYFVFYPFESDFLVTLGYQGKVYLTSIIKKSLVDVKKTINYAQAYFGIPATKVYLPSSLESVFDVPDIEKSIYSDSQVVIDLKLPSNLPLPVAGIIGSPMENKKNILPIIAVALFTAIIAAVIVYFALNQNSKPTEVTDPNVAMITPIPTENTVTPTPEVTVVAPSKSLKLQVLNATDISGQAAVIKEKLVKLGFTSVNIGNATEKATANEIRIKSTLSSASAYFTSNISEFATATTNSTVKANATYDVVFIIGTDLSTGSAPVATSTPKVSVTPTAKPTASQ